ncbi:TPA: hypothetical protein ACS7ZV_003563 [Providencia alcalifaciens]
MKTALNYPITLAFSFKKAVIENGKSYMNTYKIQKPITVKSEEELNEVLKQIEKKCGVNVINIEYKAI